MRKFFLGIKSLHSFWKKIWSREIAAGLAFYFVTGFSPVLCALLFFCGKIFPEEFFENSLFFGAVSDFIKSFNVSALNTVRRGGVVLILTSVYSSVNLFYRFKRCGVILYAFETEEKTFTAKIRSLFFVGLTVIFFVITGFTYFVANAVFKGIILKISVSVIASAASFFLLIIMHLLVCPYRLSVREVFGGSVVTFVLLAFLSAGFGAYLDKFAHFEKTYGALAGFFSFVVYSYFMMQAFTFGIAYNISHLGKLKGLARKKR
ncbi:MAG: YihY/virulence factor BrkB family protein [Clostridia bacterium]|nr:YihY/virulence factor BrkB family protein [Clostridia bacterium]